MILNESCRADVAVIKADIHLLSFSMERRL